MMQFGDSMLPTGAFAFSSALEAAVQKKVVHDVATLRQFVETAVEQAARGDAVGVAWASRAAREALAGEKAAGMAALCAVDEALFVRKLPEEARAMTVRTGRKLAELGTAVTGSPLLAAWLELIRSDRAHGVYPATLAVLMAATLAGEDPGGRGLLTSGKSGGEGDVPARGLPEDGEILKQTLTVHLYGVAMGLLNASLRLMRVTHTEAQSVLYRVSEDFGRLCAEAARAPLESMSGYAPMTDILAAVHARAHVRLFMS